MKNNIIFLIVFIGLSLALIFGYNTYQNTKLEKSQIKQEEKEKKEKKEKGIELLETYLNEKNIEIKSKEKSDFLLYKIKLEEGLDFKFKYIKFKKYKNENEITYKFKGKEIIKIEIEYFKVYRLAFLIDDVGENTIIAKDFLEIKKPLTFAIIPFLRRSKQANELLTENGYKTILHMPMEGSNKRLNNKTKGLLRTTMDNSSIKEVFKLAIEDVGEIEGFNNHMGSTFTTYKDGMKAVLEVAKEKDMMFIDSWTSNKSVALATAKELGVKTFRSKVFIDNKKEVEYIKERIKVAVKKTKKQGKIIAIGHYHPKTAQAIKEMLEYIENEGVTLVFADSFVE